MGHLCHCLLQRHLVSSLELRSPSQAGPDSVLDACNQEWRPVTDLRICRSPAVSFAYERGWRQNFVWYGFPGMACHPQ